MQGINKKVAIPMVAFSMLVGGALTGYATLASAQTANSAEATTSQTKANWKVKLGLGKRAAKRGMHGLAGNVTAISGNTITVTGKNGQTYTIDAATAKIERMDTISIGDIKVGDTIGVQGSLSGNTVTAKNILDGLKLPTKN